MVDREKVLKGLERCSKHDGSECPQCPYFNGECTDDLMADALALLKEQEHKDKMFHALEDDWKRLKALLKEQEAVEPKQVDLYGNDEWWGLVCVCPDCKAEWMSDKADTHFCPKCGRAVKWE